MTLALKINEVLRERSLMLWLDAFVSVLRQQGLGLGWGGQSGPSRPEPSCHWQIFLWPPVTVVALADSRSYCLIPFKLF